MHRSTRRRSVGPLNGMTNAARLGSFVLAYADLIRQHRDELTELDAAIGDADHGINMERGMTAVAERLPGDESTPEALLKAVAMSLISKVGGASGPLYGTAFLRASAAVTGKPELTPPDVAMLFRAALGGIRERGKAELGDKTMVDAFEPAVVALESAVAGGRDLHAAFADALAAARAGSDATIPLVARKGRASYLGERAQGHRDPGSLSTALLFEAAAITIGVDS